MLPVKLLGAALIVGSSGWIGLRAAWRLRRMNGQLKELQNVLILMESELQFANTKYADLCKTLQHRTTGSISAFFGGLLEEVSKPDFLPTGATKRNADRAGLDLPPAALYALEQLFDGFGRYDLKGQLKQIAHAEAVLEEQSESLRTQLDSRCRTYATLGICSGIAVMILVM